VPERTLQAGAEPEAAQKQGLGDRSGTIPDHQPHRAEGTGRRRRLPQGDGPGIWRIGGKGNDIHAPFITRKP
jgi:hypothetical protein